MKTAALFACVLLSGASLAAEPPADSPAAKAAAVEAVPDISRDELSARLEKQDPDIVVLDVRTPEEFAAGHLPGARNVPHDQLPARLAELALLKDQSVVLYCRSGRRAAIAARVLRAEGFDKLLHLDGDIIGWQSAGLPLEREDEGEESR